MYNSSQCTESMRRWMTWSLLCSCKCNVVTDLCSWQFITSLVNCSTLRARLICHEGWSAVKGDQTCFLHSVPVHWLSYCFLCGAWSVQLQSHLTVLMEDPQLINIEVPGRWCEGWSAVKGDRMCVLHSVPVHWLSYCFLCGAWSVQL